MTKGKRATFFDHLADFTPTQVRLLAKLPGGGRQSLAISDAELAISSGLPLNRIREISYSQSWDAIPLGEIKAFFAACHFDPTKAAHRNRVAEYYRVCQKRKTKVFQYLRNHPKWESEFLPLVKLLKFPSSPKNSFSESPPLPSLAQTSAA